jgi:hypothetical protein
MKIDVLIRPWALLCALVLVVASLMMSGTAVANHDNRTLKLSPEQRNNVVNGSHKVTATLSATPDAGPITIHFEVDGPGDPGPSGPGSGDADSVNAPDGNTPESPDRTCVVDVGATECEVRYRSSVEGNDEIRGWIDHDETVEADMEEGWDESLEPGDVPEKDNTDVIKTKWYAGLPRGANLTCAPDSPSRPQNENNTVTCTLKNKSGTGFAGWLIDAENLAGANDPDKSKAFNGLADYDNICTTAEDGTCTADIPAEPRKEAGTATVCFWVDLDDDASYHMTPKRDGAQCDDPEPAPGEDQGSHDTTAFAKVRWTSIIPSVTLTTSKTTTTSMERFRLSGSVESGTPGCEAGGASVEIYQKRLGSEVELAKTITTDADGNYGAGFRRRFSADYHAKLAVEGCTAAESEAQRVNVKKKLTLEPNRKAVRKGRTVKLRAKVMSCTPDATDKVVLTKLVKGVYKKRDVARTNDNCVAVFRQRIKKRSVFKARSPKDEDQLAGFSRRVAVRLR